MSRHTPHRRNRGIGVPASIGRLVRSLGAAVRGRRAKQTPVNPFEAALGAAGGAGNGGDVVAALTEHAITLGPLVKRRIFTDFEGVPEGLQLGWAQLPVTQGASFSLGAFTDRNHFSQIALADSKGRVFVGTDPAMDTHGMDVRFMFGKEGELRLPDGPRLGHHAEQGGGAIVDAIQGGIVGRDETGRMTWLSSWLKTNNRYTLEQVRATLPASMRFDLEYRDAITIAFFATYMLPQMHGLLIGFGAGNIFRRLNREAPIGAIRRSLRDTLDARAHGMRASGLEDHFADLMHEAKVLDQTTGLEAVHGAEPLRLYTSTYSGNYFFTWDSGLQFPAALKSLKIEGNLNRFANVSAWLERNARLGLTPTEDTVTRAQAAQIDWMLLTNPALIALKSEADPSPAAVAAGSGWHAVTRLIDEARDQSRRLSERYPDPIAAARGGSGEDILADSEWLYRRTLSTLLRRLRLPYRFDVDFRANLTGGETAIGFTTAGPSMMPSSRYDDAKHAWVSLSDDDRAALSAEYNLRAGLMMAALSFGTSPRIRWVSLHIDSIGLEEAVAEQDSAISDLMGRMLRSFESARWGDAGLGGSKADPKDGDYHGDPSHTLPRTVDDAADEGEPAEAAPADGRGDLPASGRADGAGAGAGKPGGQSDKDVLDSQFEDLMRDVDLDEVMFNVPGDNGMDAAPDAGGIGNGPDGGAFAGDGREALPAGADGPDDPDDPDDPLSALRANPTVRTMVTVTFTRDELLGRLYEDGLEHPIGTYRMFGAVMSLDGHGGLTPVEPGFDLHDSRFAPNGSQDEPELSDRTFSPAVARVLGAEDEAGLSIQRTDLLQRGVAAFHRLAADEDLPSVAKAQRAMRLIDRIGDPELSALAPQVTSALIDGKDTPDFEFQLNAELDRERLKARDLLFSGQADRAIEVIEAELERIDIMFANNPGVPRYFNSYAERVVYNRLFATTGEQTVLIPDDLFYAHTEAADVLSQTRGAQAALPHLNAMVSYAPAYPLSHLKLAVQLARREDWDSARAACLNALRVALDRDDAAFAYYRFAYAEWMRDQFAVGVAAYIMSEYISPGQIGALDEELHELVARANSQCVVVPDSVEAAKAVLAAHDLPVWPHTEAATIVNDAARVSVDEGMFVPARTLSVACARMNDDPNDGIDVVQNQFLRSLNP